MGAIENAKTYGLTIRESADDGSDFTNPDADYRRLFLGEDGQLHVKDSAGTVTGIGGAVADILDLDTVEDDDTLRLAPDGAGGVEWAAGGGTGLDTGTSFPVGPTAGDRYRRSDLDYLVFFYDGTRWVTEQLFSINGSGRFDAGVNMSSSKVDLIGNVTRGGTLAVLLVRADFSAYVATTNNGSNYWKASVETMAVGATSGTERLAPTTAAFTASQYMVATDATAVAVAAADAGTLRVTFTKVSSPGNLYPAITIYYRWIAT